VDLGDYDVPEGDRFSRHNLGTEDTTYPKGEAREHKHLQTATMEGENINIQRFIDCRRGGSNVRTDERARSDPGSVQ
jgi:hypothetical protein